MDQKQAGNGQPVPTIREGIGLAVDVSKLHAVRWGIDMEFARLRNLEPQVAQDLEEALLDIQVAIDGAIGKATVAAVNTLRTAAHAEAEAARKKESKDVTD